MSERSDPEAGALVRDTTRDRVGVVMGRHAGRVYLRPRGGGVEWTARAEELAGADENDELRARVAELNAAKGWGRRCPPRSCSNSSLEQEPGDGVGAADAGPVPSSRVQSERRTAWTDAYRSASRESSG